MKLTESEKRKVIQKVIDRGGGLDGFRLSALLEKDMKRETKFECDYQAAKMLTEKPLAARLKLGLNQN